LGSVSRMTVDVRRQALQYEAFVDGELVGELAVSRRGDTVIALHTEVESDAEGKGVGSTLARTLFEDARTAGHRVVVRCPFVAGWISRHPEYAELVSR
jgi:predicted GNAT family acetyltransferase